MVRHPGLFLAIATFLLCNGVMATEAQSGKPAPDCKLQPVGGGPTSELLKQYRGKPVYLDFWASWCGPCVQSFPFMNTLNKDYKAKGLEVVAVNLDENPDEAKAFLAKTPAQFTVLADTSGQCPQDFGVQAMPSSYLIDRNGVVRHVHLGFKAGETADLKKQIETVLK